MTAEERMNLYKKFITHETKIVGYAPFLLLNKLQRFDHGEELCARILDEVKENFPWVKIVVGGPVFNWYMAKGINMISTKVDAVFEGEGENSFLKYCDYVFKKGAHPPFTIKNSVKVIPPSDQFDMQTCGMRFEKNDFIVAGESLPLEFSRGCIFKCKFCQYPHLGKDKDDFNRPIESIKETLLYHYENFGTTRYHISDDTLNSHRERTKKFYEMTKTLPFKLEYVGYVRLDLLDIWPEQQDLLPESGLVSCLFGIESLNENSCKQVGKGWGAKNHKTWITKMNKYWGDDVVMMCSLIAGLGTETPKDWTDTLNWFENSNVHDYVFHPLMLSRKFKISEFEKNAEKYGYRWPNPNDPFYWESDSTNLHETLEWCRVNNTRAARVPSAWNNFYFRNMGFSKDEIVKSTYKDLRTKVHIEGRSKKFVQDYYNLAINY
jgi:radical SAM superfamily enzyme YgiQ (UPF0313 family)